MAIRHKHIKLEESPQQSPYRNAFNQLPVNATAAFPAAAAANEGSFAYDTTLNTPVFSDGASWVQVSTTAGVGTLQQVTTAGATSNVVSLRFSGSAASATAFGVGGAAANDKLVLYHDATDGHLNTLAGDLHIEPAGGDTVVTGTLTSTGALAGASVAATGAVTAASGVITGALTVGSIAMDAVVASTPASALSLDGEGAGGVTLGTTSTGNIALMRNTTLAASRTLVLAGVGASNIFTMTAGDMVMSDGSLTITDADNASSLVLVNNTFAAGNLVDISGTGVVTGNMLAITANNLTAGTMIYLASSAAGFAGKYLQCYDGAADDFSVGLYGATIIAGNAEGTAALTVSAGDLKLSAGVIDQDAAADNANVFTRAQAVTTKDYFQILCTNAADDEAALYVAHSGTGAVPAVEFTSAGSAEALLLTNTKTDGRCLLAQNGVASATVPCVAIDGTTNDWIGASGAGMLHVQTDGALAHANASCVLISYSGAGAATGLGTCLRIVDAGTTATSYGFYVDSATGEAMKVDRGKCVFDEGVLVGDGAVGYVSSNGAQDLVLRTNEGTDSGTITITDAANGNITIDPNGTGRVAVVGAALANGTAHTNMLQVVCMPYVAASFDANDDIILFNANSPKIKIVDAWLDNDTAEGGALTLTLRDAAAGAGNVISSALDANVTTIGRATTLTTVALAANSSVIAHASANPAAAVGTIYVSFIEVA